jgi:hypothetical protein
VIMALFGRCLGFGINRTLAYVSFRAAIARIINVKSQISHSVRNDKRKPY